MKKTKEKKRTLVIAELIYGNKKNPQDQLRITVEHDGIILGSLDDLPRDNMKANFDRIAGRAIYMIKEKYFKEIG